ncbi:helix-turn-helix domain-containing protein [Paracoccus sp. ME4]|uniref:helix-turn-helix domain-containing protein n=1 Tax=Paracoccus sp. ME4 TaxID=3138066 RepID=UPI00398A8087
MAIPTRPLSPDAIRRIGVSLFGDGAGWQSRMAERMGYDRSAVTRWLNGSVPMPRHASLLLLYMERYGVPEIALGGNHDE